MFWLAAMFITPIEGLDRIGRMPLIGTPHRVFGPTEKGARGVHPVGYGCFRGSRTTTQAISVRKLNFLASARPRLAPRPTSPYGRAPFGYPDATASLRLERSAAPIPRRLRPEVGADGCSR